ncbi:MAG: PaaI family thioesterase [Candidatus Binatia bacterium]
MSREAFQDLGSVSHCYGCGADNQSGLQIKSTWEGDEAVCVWEAQPHHCGGSKDNVNGGILATLIDCHSLNLAIAHAFKQEGRAIGSAPKIYYVTGNLNISYVRPTPIHKSIHLQAKIMKAEGRKTWVHCVLSSDEHVCAIGEVLGIRVQGWAD